MSWMTGSIKFFLLYLHYEAQETKLISTEGVSQLKTKLFEFFTP